MSDIKLDQTPTKHLPRRAALQLGGVALASAVLSRFIPAPTVSKEISNIASAQNTPVVEKQVRIEDLLPPELTPLVQEIIQYRQALNLEDLPQGFLDKLKNPKKWDSPAPDFQINLPEKNKSYGLFVKEAVEKIFGLNGTRLAKEAGTYNDNPNFYGFDIRERKFIISNVIHEQVPLETFLDFVLHEAIGHGSDPELFNYPPEVLVRIEHGKWKALTQCMSVEKQFLNHEYDQVLPQIKADVGETIARTLVDGKPLSEIVDQQGEAVINDAIMEISERKGVQQKELKFNKKICREIGEIVIAQFLKKNISLSGKLKLRYQQSLERGLVEIYAEMVKQSIAHPDEIGNNKEILEGVTEVVSAVRGETVNIKLINESVKNPSEEISLRYQDEKEALKEERVGQPTPTPKKLTPEEIAKLKDEEDKRKQQSMMIEKFVTEGVIPSNFVLAQKEMEIIQEFASLLSQYTKLFPALYKGGDFDPDSLHIWEIREVENATRIEFVNNLLLDKKDTGQYIKEAEDQTQVLKKYSHILSLAITVPTL